MVLWDMIPMENIKDFEVGEEEEEEMEEVKATQGKRVFPLRNKLQQDITPNAPPNPSMLKLKTIFSTSTSTSISKVHCNMLNDMKKIKTNIYLHELLKINQ
jgi:hypothetical protein